MRRSLWLYLVSLCTILPFLYACQEEVAENAIVEPVSEPDADSGARSICLLRQAHESGKVIEEFIPVFGGKSGYLIRFTDGTTIELLQAKENCNDYFESNPSVFFCIDEDSVWNISRFGSNDTRIINSRLQTPSGKPLKGKAYSIRTSAQQNNYSYNFYEYDDSINAIASYERNYGELSPLIISVVENKLTHELTLTFSDGEQLTFAMSYPQAEKIEWRGMIPVSLNCGDTLALPFIITPDQFVFNHDMNGDSCDIRIISAASNTSFDVNAIELLAVRNRTRNGWAFGDYEVLLTSRHAVDSITIGQIALELTVRDSQTGNHTLISSPLILSLLPEGMTARPISTLPVVFIDTPSRQTIDSKEEWTKHTSMTIYYPDGSIDYQGTVAIKGRGNYTWLFPKKPYALKLNSKASILGMAADRRWVLLANWIDRTLLRNDVALAIARALDMEWVPSGQFVDLVMNGNYVGNYYLCEQVNVSPERVNIDEYGEGGECLLEVDAYYDEPYKFRSTWRDLPYMVKSPDTEAITPRMFDNIKDYVNNMEAALYDEAQFANKEYRNYIDMESFAKFWIVQELTANHEPGYPKSVFLFKDNSGKLKAGPVWDFDYGTFAQREGYTLRDYLYYPQLFQDSYFTTCVKNVWENSRSRLKSIFTSYISMQADAIRISEESNHHLWPITFDFPAGDEHLTFNEAVERLTEVYKERFYWLDNEISSFK